jgi:F-type H+-transporting ATPase subunit b
MASEAQTLAATPDAYHAEALLLGMGAETWVYISVSIFLLLAVFVGKLPQRIAEGLDAHINGVKRQLNEAAAIRAEAEALLAETQRKAAAAAGDAEAILARAHSEASQLVADAKTGLDLTIARRKAAAEQKIDVAGRTAEADIRRRAAELAVASARAELVKRAPAEADKLTSASISELERRLN